MPEQDTLERAERDKREGKAPSIAIACLVERAGAHGGTQSR